MTVALFKDGFPSAHRTTRQRIESSLDLRRLFFAIDADPVLIGAGVVYIDGDFNVVVLREFQAICSVRPIKVVLREAPRSVGAVEFKRMLEHEPRESRLVSEALNTAVTCAGAILSWVVISSGFALMPFTAGTSAVISLIGQAAAVAGTVQCIAGVLRTGSEAAFPEFNDYLDSEFWYQDATVVQLEKAKGRFPKRISAAKMQHATATHIIDVLTATLSFTSSATNGNVRTLAIGIYEELSQ